MVEKDYKLLASETEYEYIYRICSQKPQIGTWQDVADILNEELGNEYTESKYRKMFQSFSKMFEANLKKVGDEESYSATIEEELRELRRERMKLQTEKLEYNRWLRDHARDELIEEKICDAIKALPELEGKEFCCEENRDVERVDSENGKTAIICFGDEHYGAEFDIVGLYGESLNEYNPDIFERRMNELGSWIIDFIHTRHLSKLKIYSFGDELDGVLRVSQLSKLKYGVIDSAIMYSEFICKWIANLLMYVDIEYHMVAGNHTELRMLGQPKGTFENENMSKIIRTFIRTRFAGDARFKMVENPSGYIFDTVYGNNILGVHGEEKNMDAAIKSFSINYGVEIDTLIGGHKHHYACEAVGVNKQYITVPSLIGIDGFSMSIGKTSDAGALCLVFDEMFGLTETHYIKFTI